LNIKLYAIIYTIPYNINKLTEYPSLVYLNYTLLLNIEAYNALFKIGLKYLSLIAAESLFWINIF